MESLILIVFLSIICLIAAVILEFKKKYKKTRDGGNYEAISDWIYLYGFLFNYFILMMIGCIADYLDGFDIVEMYFLRGGWWHCALLCLISYLPISWIYGRFFDSFVRKLYLEKYLDETGLLSKDVAKIQSVITLCKQLPYIPLIVNNDNTFGEFVGNSFRFESSYSYLELTGLLSIDGISGNGFYVNIDSQCELSKYACISQFVDCDNDIHYLLCVLFPFEKKIEKDVYLKLLKTRLRNIGYKINGNSLHF